MVYYSCAHSRIYFNTFYVTDISCKIDHVGRSIICWIGMKSPNQLSIFRGSVETFWVGSPNAMAGDNKWNHDKIQDVLVSFHSKSYSFIVVPLYLLFSSWKPPICFSINTLLSIRYYEVETTMTKHNAKLILVKSLLILPGNQVFFSRPIWITLVSYCWPFKYEIFAHGIFVHFGWPAIIDDERILSMSGISLALNAAPICRSCPILTQNELRIIFVVLAACKFTRKMK